MPAAMHEQHISASRPGIGPPNYTSSSATTDAASIPTHCGGEGMNTKVSGGCGSELRRLALD